MELEKIKHYVNQLEKEHDRLDFLIEEEYRRYQDDRAVHNLKKEKLAIKDEIEKLKKRINDYECRL